MKHACTCSTFHFNSLTRFAYEVICHEICRLLIFFSKSVCFLLLLILKLSFGNISRVPSSLDPDHAGRFVGPDLGPNCLQR